MWFYILDIFDCVTVRGGFFVVVCDVDVICAAVRVIDIIGTDHEGVVDKASTGGFYSVLKVWLEVLLGGEIDFCPGF